jgi:DNA polymerase I-like protein with 3'-5' exonuclease and polymerase domains
MKAKGHPVPKDRHREDEDGNNPDTTAAKELLRLANRTGDNFYRKVIEYRGYTKLKGTYVDGFAPGPDSRVHTTFTFQSAIAQLTSRNPNIQNFPKLKPTPELAKAMRAMVRARSGHLITEWDFKSCHVITLGFLAEDEQYMRLGRLDIHSFVAGHFLGLWDGRAIVHETDDQLRARFKWLKSDPARKIIRDDQAKHGILGIGNGLKAKGLYERYMEQFPPRPCVRCKGTGKECGAVPGRMRNCAHCKGTRLIPGMRIAEQVLETCEALFPKVFAFQRAEVKQAHERMELRTDFGHLRRFYEVFRWDGARRDWAPGDQHEEAVAFRLANIAHAHMREKLKDLARAELDRKWGLFNTVHDSLMFEVPESRLDEHIADVRPLLLAPSTVLRHPRLCPDGLVIDVEGSCGPNWAEMEPIEIAAPKEAA